MDMDTRSSGFISLLFTCLNDTMNIFLGNIFFALFKITNSFWNRHREKMHLQPFGRSNILLCSSFHESVCLLFSLLNLFEMKYKQKLAFGQVLFI